MYIVGMRHILFFAGVFAVILAVVMSFPTESEVEEAQYSRITEEPPLEGTVCCTRVVEGESRSCVAVPPRGCEVCAGFCEYA